MAIDEPTGDLGCRDLLPDRLGGLHVPEDVAHLLERHSEAAALIGEVIDPQGSHSPQRGALKSDEQVWINLLQLLGSDLRERLGEIFHQVAH